MHDTRIRSGLRAKARESSENEAEASSRQDAMRLFAGRRETGPPDRRCICGHFQRASFLAWSRNGGEVTLILRCSSRIGQRFQRIRRELTSNQRPLKNRRGKGGRGKKKKKKGRHPPRFLTVYGFWWEDQTRLCRAPNRPAAGMKVTWGLGVDMTALVDWQGSRPWNAVLRGRSDRLAFA